MLLLKANDLVLEYETVMKALSRDAQDDELGMMRIELQARASALDADLDDEESWGHQSAHGLSGMCPPVRADTPYHQVLNRQKGSGWAKSAAGSPRG
jgi:hypothetical protein